MNFKLNSQPIKLYKLLLEEYFALKIDMGYVWGEPHQSFEISKDDNCLFEFSINKNNELCEAILITNTDYCIKNEDLQYQLLPQEGVIIVEKPKNLFAEKFEVVVFKNGLQITFSENFPACAYKQGEFVVYLGDDGKITALQVWNLNKEEREHLLLELRYNKEGKS